MELKVGDSIKFRKHLNEKSKLLYIPCDFNTNFVDIQHGDLYYNNHFPLKIISINGEDCLISYKDKFNEMVRLGFKAEDIIKVNHIKLIYDEYGYIKDEVKG